MKVILLRRRPVAGEAWNRSQCGRRLRQQLPFSARPRRRSVGGALKMLEQQIGRSSAAKPKKSRTLGEVADQLEQLVLRVAAKAGGNGRLFGTVTNAQVADAIHAQLNVAIDRHKIEMKDGIKALGTYPVQVRLGNNIIAKTSVQVVNQS